MHTDRNSRDTKNISNMNNDLKSNDRNSKNKSENDFHDIYLFVERTLNNELIVFYNDFDNMMNKNVNLNNANDFKRNEFDYLKDENFDNLFINKKMRLNKQIHNNRFRKMKLNKNIDSFSFH